MPRMDGYSAVAHLRSLNYQKPIIAITGNSQDSEIKRCHEVGYNDVLVKPVQLNTLTSTILRWVSPPSPQLPISAQSINISPTT